MKGHDRLPGQQRPKDVGLSNGLGSASNSPWQWFRSLWKEATHDGPYVRLDLRDEQSKAAAAGAAMAHVLSRPDSIRQRAQNAATISSAVAAALVIAAAGQVGGGGEYYKRVTILVVIAAIGLWAIGVGLFVFAVAFIDKGSPLTEWGDYHELVEEYEKYADRVRLRMRRAALVSGLALLVTVVAVGAELGEQADHKSMRLLLTEEGASDVLKLSKCPASPTTLKYIDGELPESELGQSIVQVQDVTGVFKKPRPTDSDCDKEVDTVRLPRSSVRAAIND